MHIGVFNLTTDFVSSWVPTWTYDGTQNLGKPLKLRFRRILKNIRFSSWFLCACGVLGANLAPSWRPSQPNTTAKRAHELLGTVPETVPGALGSKRTEHPTRLGPPKPRPGPPKIKQFFRISKSNWIRFRYFFEQVFNGSGPLVFEWFGFISLTICLLKPSLLLDYTTKDYSGDESKNQ